MVVFEELTPPHIGDWLTLTNFGEGIDKKQIDRIKPQTNQCLDRLDNQTFAEKFN